jgi:hypothetical protein
LPSRISANVAGNIRIVPRATATRCVSLLAADVDHMRMAGGVEVGKS